MNIQSRLKKMENQIITDSNTCICNGLEPKIKCTYADDGVLRVPSEAVCEICAVCEKAINQMLIVVDFLSPEKPEDASIEASTFEM